MLTAQEWSVNGPYYGYGPGYGPYYGYGPGYYPRPVYYDESPCYWSPRRFWDGWRWHVRRVRVCD